MGLEPEGDEPLPGLLGAQAAGVEANGVQLGLPAPYPEDGRHPLVEQVVPTAEQVVLAGLSQHGNVLVCAENLGEWPVDQVGPPRAG
jgi:hypothetical protein